MFVKYNAVLSKLQVIGNIHYLKKCYEVGVGEVVLDDISVMAASNFPVAHDVVMFLKRYGRIIAHRPEQALQLAFDSPVNSHLAQILRVQHGPGRMPMAKIWRQSILKARDWPSQTAVLTGHEKPVTSVSLSRDSRMVLSGAEDGTVRLWDAGTGTAYAVMGSDYKQIVHKVLFSPDSTLLVSSASDKTLRLWDAATGLKLAESTTTENVHSMAFTDNLQNNLLFPDGGIRSWDLAKAQQASISSLCKSDSIKAARDTHVPFRSRTQHDLERIFHSGATGEDLAERGTTLQGFCLNPFLDWAIAQRETSGGHTSMGLLWITGDRGTGKTALSTSIMGHMSANPVREAAAEEDTAPTDADIKIIALLLQQSDSRSHGAAAAVFSLAEQLRKLFPAEMAGYDPVQHAAALVTLGKGDRVVLTKDYKEYSDADGGPLMPGQVCYLHLPF